MGMGWDGNGKEVTEMGGDGRIRRLLADTTS